MSDSFYIQVRGKRQGPFTVERLRHLAKLGRFGRQHRVSTDGRSWKPADNYPELFEAQGERKMRQSGVVENPGSSDAASVAPAAPASAGWFYSHDGQQLGPVSMEILKHSHTTGTLNADDLVWTHGMTEWKRADKALPGLFSGEAVAAPGPGGGPSAETIQSHAPTSNLAIYSLVLSIIPVVGSVAAVICGHKALREIYDSNSNMQGRNLALAGLCIGYAVISLVVIFGLYSLSSGAFAPSTGGGWQPVVAPEGAGGVDSLGFPAQK